MHLLTALHVTAPNAPLANLSGFLNGYSVIESPADGALLPAHALR